MNRARLIFTAIGAGAFAGIYLVLAESFGALELVAAGITGILVALLIAAISQHAEMHFRFRLSWLTELAPLPIQILKDSATILLALPQFLITPRSPIGKFKFVPIEHGAHPEDSAEVAGWRAFTILGISIPPNTYVVRIEDTRILVHQLLERLHAARATR